MDKKVTFLDDEDYSKVMGSRTSIDLKSEQVFADH
jgi:hypothetical protein